MSSAGFPSQQSTCRCGGRLGSAWTQPQRDLHANALDAERTSQTQLRSSENGFTHTPGLLGAFDQSCWAESVDFH